MAKKVCVVTGATGGIGSAAVRQMCEKYYVLVSDINQEKIDAKVAEMRALGFEAEGMVCDTSSREQCDALAAKAASMGEIAGVIQLAGLTPGFCTHKDLVSVDVMGTMNINEAFFHVMNGGCIVDICSCAGHFMPQDIWPVDIFELALTDKQKFYDDFNEYLEDFGDEETATNMAYVWGRTFIYWYVRKAAYAFGRKKGIRLLSVSIGFVTTERSMADLAATGADVEERLGVQISYTAFGRPGTPEEVAFLFDTLIDERNSYLTGTDIYFDNGCDANDYTGQFDPFDPSSNPYDPGK